MYGERSRACSASPPARAVPLRAAQTHHVRRWAAQLHGARPGAAHHRARAVGLARLLSLARPRRPGRRQPGRRRARAARRAAVAEGAVGRPRGGAGRRIATRAATRRLAARDACIAELLYGCGLRVGELVGLDVVASGARGRLDRRRRRQRARPRQGQQAPQRAGRRAGAGGARRLAGAARRARARRRAGALRQQPRHAPDARARCARA